MTVEELIEELKNIDGKKDVYVRGIDGYLNNVEYAKVDNVGDVVIETSKY